MRISNKSMPDTTNGERLNVQPQNTVLIDKIRELMTDQSYGVLCTQGEGHAYGSMIAFAVNPQLNSVVFVTPIDTYKYRLLSQCSGVALVVDNRQATASADQPCIDAMTITGVAVRLNNKDAIEMASSSLLEKHPGMHGFITTPGNAYFRIDIDRYLHVNCSNEVDEWFPPHPV